MVILRPAVRWLLWSRRRFILVVAATALSAVVVSRGPAVVTAIAANPVAPTTAAAAPAPPAASSAPPPPVATTSSTPTPSRSAPASGAPRRDEPREIALRFARLWASPQTAPREWLRRLEPLSTPEYAATVLAQIDPANVPASEVTGPPRRVESPTGTAVFVVRFDTIEAEIELTELSQERASENSRAANGDPERAGAEETTWRVSAMRPLRTA
ncbi:hypothetical protein K1T35_47905 (plasmid) [Pseudonocardia sp. DSM 110487]|uniref:hypothetical protein n=1 Tax=Pseudonocardia sp. DSM 110487 TaxID=2865833 RepID=UPI001C69FAF8|nr:hypothetical protein [Pseudonocardia sp. DSM 110487]QYN41076.1 hypothetical protein K1T35_47905 [Pseudonocardia sp. DSM 110487]